MEESRDVKYTYLDVSGRPVVVLKKSHLVPEHGQKLHITYSFPAFGWLREPFMLIAGETHCTFFRITVSNKYSALLVMSRVHERRTCRFID